MNHEWKLLPQDMEFLYIQDYQCINCWSYKSININNKDITYSERAFDQTVYYEIRPCTEIIMESILK